MLPLFFEETWGLSAAAAGLIAASFAFVNLFARPMGGLVSDRMGNRRFVMLAYMFGIGIGFTLMGLLDSNWPLIVAIAITIFCSFFVQGAEGATFGIIPSIKRRLTGQISGMAGAYGNVGAVFYLFVFTFVTYSQFFFIIAAGAFASWLICYLWLRSPRAASRTSTSSPRSTRRSPARPRSGSGRRRNSPRSSRAAARSSSPSGAPV
jgi:MFS transporter, NNP family, nitrate/nitrite transporter